MNILKLKPVWYRSTCEGDNPEWSHFGLIAEQVAKIDERLAMWDFAPEDRYVDSDGFQKIKEGAKLRPDGVDYIRVFVLLLDLVQQQEDRLSKLEKETNV